MLLFIILFFKKKCQCPLSARAGASGPTWRVMVASPVDPEQGRYGIDNVCSGNKYFQHRTQSDEGKDVYKQCRILPKIAGENQIPVQYVKTAGKNFDDMSVNEKVTMANPEDLSSLVYPEAGKCFDGTNAEPRWELYKGVFEGVDMDADEDATTAALTKNWERGLTTEEALLRAAKHGKNALDEKKVNPLIELLKEFWGPMPIMIWLAAGVEVLEKDWPDFAVLIVLLLANGLLGWYENMKAGDAIQKLKDSLTLKCVVRRDGKPVDNFQVADLVPGDCVLLTSGGPIPGDCEVISLLSEQLKVDQAPLTGESLPVSMHVGKLSKMGSTVTSGKAMAVVFDHGRNTFMGKTASMIASVDEVGHFQVCCTLGSPAYMRKMYTLLFAPTVISRSSFSRSRPSL